MVDGLKATGALRAYKPTEVEALRLKLKRLFLFQMVWAAETFGVYRNLGI